MSLVPAIDAATAQCTAALLTHGPQRLTGSNIPMQ